MGFFDKLFTPSRNHASSRTFICSNNKINETISNASRLHYDLFMFDTSKLCPQCSPYKYRIYSISGKSHIYPSIYDIPEFLKVNHCSVCGCYINVLSVYDDFLNNHPDIIQLNSTPITDTRTPEQVALFEEKKLMELRKSIMQTEYDFILKNLPEICPKNLASYSRMKNSNSANFQKIVAAAKEKGFEIKIL